MHCIDVMILNATSGTITTTRRPSTEANAGSTGAAGQPTPLAATTTTPPQTFPMSLSATLDPPLDTIVDSTLKISKYFGEKAR